MDISISGSDTASDFAHMCGSALAKMMQKELLEKNSEWNTDGDCNVGLFFHEVIVPSGHLKFNDELQKIARKTLKSLEGRGWFGRKDRNKDLDKDFRKIVCSLKKFLQDRN